MQLVCPIPTIHFKPFENKKKSGKGEALAKGHEKAGGHWEEGCRARPAVAPVPASHGVQHLFCESPSVLSPGMYSCPCYYYPNRAGTAGRTSFVIGVDLRSGAMPSDHWIKRGTALLMSLDA